jgi:hypothetical protein
MDQRRVHDNGIPGFESRNASEANLEYVDGGIASYVVVIGSPRQRVLVWVDSDE